MSCKLRSLYKIGKRGLERRKTPLTEKVVDIQLGIFYLKMSRRIVAKKFTIEQAKVLIERKKGNYGLG